MKIDTDIILGLGIITLTGLAVIAPFIIATLIWGILGLAWSLIIVGILILSLVIGTAILSAVLKEQ